VTQAGFFIALARGSSAAPSTTLRVVPLPRFTGAEKESMIAESPFTPGDGEKLMI
jgi:hypothetical protein